MSAYENAVQECKRIDALIETLESQIASGNRDKVGLSWRAGKVTSESMAFFTDAHVGYYGNSSVAGKNSESLARELAQTLTELKPTIIKHAVARLMKRKQAALRAAKEEAEQVLVQIAEEKEGE